MAQRATNPGSAYRPAINRLSMLLEFGAQVILSVGAAGAVGTLISQSLLVVLSTAGGAAATWVGVCFRTEIRLTGDTVQLVNRWRRRVIPRDAIRRFETRPATTGFFDAGGRSMVVAVIVLDDDAGVVPIDVSVSVSRRQRQRLVDLLKADGYEVGNLSEYVAGGAARG